MTRKERLEATLRREPVDRALRKCAIPLLRKTEAVARALPGRLWRIYGPEYVRPMVAAIKRRDGFARIHCHGRIRDILSDILDTGCDGIDPVEPPTQGDITLAEARASAGDDVVLFGNLEVADMGTLPPPRFARKVRTVTAPGLC